MEKKALLIVSEGYEDLETVAPIDVLKRVGVEVTVAALHNKLLRGAWGTTILADILLDDLSDEYDAVIFPGGIKNALSLASDARVREIACDYARKGKLLAAICASPSHLLGEATGLLKGKNASGDPSFHEKLAACGAIVSKEALTIDGNFITASGPGSALLFGLKIAQYLVGYEIVRPLAERWGVPLEK